MKLLPSSKGREAVIAFMRRRRRTRRKRRRRRKDPLGHELEKGQNFPTRMVFTWGHAT